MIENFKSAYEETLLITVGKKFYFCMLLIKSFQALTFSVKEHESFPA